MAIRVLFATAHRQTLTIQYENPFGDCFTEYDLDEYTAQDAAKTGRDCRTDAASVQPRNAGRFRRAFYRSPLHPGRLRRSRCRLTISAGGSRHEIL